jgi:hypothetical protein
MVHRPNIFPFTSMNSHVKNPWWMSGFRSPLPPEFGIDLLTTLAITEALLEALQQGLSCGNHWLDRSGFVGTNGLHPRESLQHPEKTNETMAKSQKWSDE